MQTITTDGELDMAKAENRAQELANAVTGVIPVESYRLVGNALQELRDMCQGLPLPLANGIREDFLIELLENVGGHTGDAAS